MTPVRSAEVRIDHPLDPGGLPALLVEPAGEGRFPGVVLIHERGGSGTAGRALAERLAATGLLVVVPDLLARGAGAEPADPEAMVDLDAAAEHLRAHPRGNGRVAAVGTGRGGRLALILATSPAAPDRVVDLRGPGMVRRTATVDGDHPQVPVDRVDWLRAPLLAVFAEGDLDPAPDDVAELAAALARRGLEHRVVTLAAGAAELAGAGGTGGSDQAGAWAETLGWLEPLR